MAINLTKGQRIEIGLSKVGVGLGWDPNDGTGFDFDLDASAFMLGQNKKIPKDEFFVFYNNPLSPDFGFTDAMKLKSSMTLFSLISEDPLFMQILQTYFEGKEDFLTKNIANKLAK